MTREVIYKNVHVYKIQEKYLERIYKAKMVIRIKLLHIGRYEYSHQKTQNQLTIPHSIWLILFS